MNAKAASNQPESLKAARARLSTNKLLRASAELIAEKGYERTTLAAIGARAGYSHGLVTRRFGSKDGLLTALLHKMVGEWHEREIAPVIAARPGGEALAVMIDGIRASARRDPSALRALYTLMFEALRPTPHLLHEQIEKLNRSQRETIEHAIRRGLTDGSIARGVDPAGTAVLMVSSLRGAAYQWLLDEEFDFDAALVALRDHLRRVLAPATQDETVGMRR